MSSRTLRSGALLLAAIFSGAVALLHVGCILFGAPWYRFLGAGERMVTMAERRHWYPPVLTAMIVIARSPPASSPTYPLSPRSGERGLLSVFVGALHILGLRDLSR